MSIPDSELDLDKLFLPAWAQEPASANLYAKYEGEEAPRDRDRRGRRGPPRDFPGGPRERRGERPRHGDRARPRDGAAPAQRAERGPRKEGERPPGRRPARGGRGPREDSRERREPLRPLPEIALTLLPDEKGVDSLARQIKTDGRAYPL